MEVFYFISGLLGLVSVVVFFAMAANVSAIKNILRSYGDKTASYIEFFNAGELKEFQGKPNEALIEYRAALFYVEKFLVQSPGNPTAIKNKETITAKIKTLEPALA